MSTLHAHVSTAASDCDGPMYSEYVETMNDAEKAEHAEGEARGYNNFADLTFKGRMVNYAVSLHAAGAVLTVTEDGYHYHEPTDEGYRAVEVRFCEEDCDDSEYSQRDVFAEQMGY